MGKSNKNLENSTSKLINIEILVSKLKLQDEKYMKLSRNMQWMFWILTPLYFGLFIINPDSELQLITRLGGLCYVLAFITFALYFRSYYKDYKSVNYGLPTIEMLKKAAYRYKLFHKRTLILPIPLLLIDVGVSMFFFARFESFEPIVRILIVQMFYLPIMIVSFLIGLLIWHKKQKPLRNRALEMIEEIEK